MAFTQRREYLFLYSVKDANPNGDPLNANHPRYDEETDQIWVSDVRLKRTVRDYWKQIGQTIFVDGEAKTAKMRIKELQEQLQVTKGPEVCGGCLDTRLFGVTYPIDSESFSWIGPVQFKWGRSLHRAKVELVQGTAAFATKDESNQRSFRNEYIVPYALIGAYGIANQFAASQTGATDEDLALLREGLWNGTLNLITRSKVGHEPCLLVEIVYKEGFCGAIGSLDDKVRLVKTGGEEFSREEQLGLRNLREAALDMTELGRCIAAKKEHIAQVRLQKGAPLQLKGLAEMKQALGERVVEE